MKDFIRSLDARFRYAAPPQRLALIRVLVGLFGLIYLLIRIPHFMGMTNMPGRAFAPVGPLLWMGGPVSGPVLYALITAALFLAVAFLRGWAFRVTGPLYALVLLFLTSYQSSFGMVFHTENLLVAHTVLLALIPQSADVLAAQRPTEGPPSDNYGWPLTVLGLATTLAYLLAGIAKLNGQGLAWIEGSVLMGHVAYDALRKLSVGSYYSPFGAFLMNYPFVFAPLAAFSLVLELFAPAALLNRKLGWFWSAGVWSFHMGVLAMMVIGFPYPISGIAFASFFPVEKALGWPPAARLVRTLTGSSPPAKVEA